MQQQFYPNAVNMCAYFVIIYPTGLEDSGSTILKNLQFKMLLTKNYLKISNFKLCR